MEIWSAQQTADKLGVKAETLRYWRWRSEGPRSFKVGAKTVYDRADVEAWLERQKAQTGVGAA